MKKIFLSFLFILMGGANVFSQEASPVGKSFDVTCQYEGDENFKKIGFTSLPKKGEYHYKAYLPRAYGERSQDRFPILFLMSPSGNANLERYVSILEKMELIGVALQEAKNGPWEPIIGNFLAAHDDAMGKFRVDEERKFATGFSGGARGSSIFTQIRPGFAGLLLQGAGYWSEAKSGYDKTPKGLRVYMLMGKEDSNLREVEGAKQGIPRRAKFKSELFEGGHTSASSEKISEAIEWIMIKEEVGTEQGTEQTDQSANGSSTEVTPP